MLQSGKVGGVDHRKERVDACARAQRLPPSTSSMYFTMTGSKWIAGECLEALHTRFVLGLEVSPIRKFVYLTPIFGH